MSKSEVLRGFVTERLAAASQEILAAVDGLVAGYEEEASGLRNEIDRQRRLLEVLLQPRVILHKTGGKCSRRLRHDEEDNEDEYDKNLDMNNRTPSRCFSSRGQLEQRKHSGPQISETQNHMDLRIRFQENPQTEVPSKKDLQYLFVIKEEVPLELSPCLDQEEPENPRLKEEQEELWTSQEGEQLQRLEEADDAKVPLTPVHVKNEDDEEKPQSSQPHRSRTEEIREAEPPSNSSAEQMETEADGEDCGRSEPDRNLDPHGHLQPDTDEKVSEFSKTENSDIDWKETKARFKGQTNLRWHTNVHTGEKPFVSDVCGEEFYRQDHVTMDVKVHTGEKPFGCSACGKRFNVKRNLNRHMIVHTGEKPFGCSVCGKRFNTKVYLTRHIRVHTGEKPFGCSICGKRFIAKVYLTIHLKVHTGEKPFGCSICGKRFNAKKNLTRHIRVHTGERPFGCSACGKRFKEKGSLTRHMKDHTGEKPFGCSVCGKRFKATSALTSHVRVHTGEKPFGCSVCGRRFKEKGVLTSHMKVHTGEKPFGCSVCGKRFTRRGDITLHTRVHTGETPFGCDVCGKRFKGQGELTVHTRIHTKEKPFSCSFCGKPFGHHSSRKRHMKTCKHKHVLESSSSK